MKIFLVVDEHCFDYIEERHLTAFSDIEDALKEMDKIKENFKSMSDKFFIEYMDGMTLSAYSMENGKDYIDAFINEMEVK